MMNPSASTVTVVSATGECNLIPSCPPAAGVAEGRRGDRHIRKIHVDHRQRDRVRCSCSPKRRIGSALKNGLKTTSTSSAPSKPARRSPWWSVIIHMFSSSRAIASWRSRSARVTVRPNRLVAPLSSVCNS